MKILYLVIGGLLAMVVVGCASVSRIDVDNHGFIRGLEQNIAVHEGGQKGPLLGAIKANEYFDIYIRPGGHYFTGMFDDGHGNGISAYANLRAGKTYYFQVVQLPAVAIQDIKIEPRQASEAAVAMASFTNTTASPVPVNPDKALVYFYYTLTSEEQAALEAQQLRARKLAKELHCTATELREGSCQ